MTHIAYDAIIFSAKILLFYVIFYAVLSGFFGAMLAVFYQTLDPNAPKWQLDNSLIGSNPGLGFRPMPPESNVESTLIWYKASDEGNWLHWTRALDDFLDGEREIFRIQHNLYVAYLIHLLEIRYLLTNEQFEELIYNFWDI